MRNTPWLINTEEPTFNRAGRVPTVFFLDTELNCPLRITAAELGCTPSEEEALRKALWTLGVSFSALESAIYPQIDTLAFFRDELEQTGSAEAQ